MLVDKAEPGEIISQCSLACSVYSYSVNFSNCKKQEENSTQALTTLRVSFLAGLKHHAEAESYIHVVNPQRGMGANTKPFTSRRNEMSAN